MSGEKKGPESIRPGTTPVGEMNPADTETELRNLARAIQFHDLRYHGEDAPVISDADYDALVARNRALEAAFPTLVRKDSPSLHVGAPAAAGAAAGAAPTPNRPPAAAGAAAGVAAADAPPPLMPKPSEELPSLRPLDLSGA